MAIAGPDCRVTGHPTEFEDIEYLSMTQIDVDVSTSVLPESAEPHQPHDLAAANEAFRYAGVWRTSRTHTFAGNTWCRSSREPGTCPQVCGPRLSSGNHERGIFTRDAVARSPHRSGIGRGSLNCKRMLSHGDERMPPWR